MKINEILEYLNEAGLSNVLEVENDNNALIVKFHYDFDRDEINAARSYSNEECDFEEESDEWYNESYLPYLNDIANDNVSDIIEEVMDEFEVVGQYIYYDDKKRSTNTNSFIAVFSLDEFDIDEIIEDID